MGKIYTLLQTIRHYLEPPTRCSVGVEVLYWEIKRLGSEVDHSPPFSAKVKNEWSYSSVPRTCLPGVDRDNLTFYSLQSERP
jgi:hypothetical protein